MGPILGGRETNLIQPVAEVILDFPYNYSALFGLVI